MCMWKVYDNKGADRSLLDNHEDSAQSNGILSGPRFGVRHSLVLWAFLGFCNLFMLRVDMNLALVAMAMQSSPVSGPNTSHYPLDANLSECRPVDSKHNNSQVQAEFNWSNSLQGFVLSAFYYGYFATQIPGGVLAKRYGAKKLLAGATAGCSALSLLTPLSARVHVAFLIVVRILIGGLQGLVFPATQVLLSRWAPAKERSRLVAFIYAGCQAGTVLGMLSTGYLCDTPAGWPIVFYIEGLLGLAWCVGWSLLTFDSPSLHPKISDAEREYIESSVDRSWQYLDTKIPWKSILTSPALYAIAAAHFANDWGFFAIMTCLPKFMKDILGFDMTQNGLISALPYFVTWVCNIIAGTLADHLRKPGRWRTVHVRKLMVAMGLLGPGSLLLAAAYLPGCGAVPVISLLTAAMGFSGFTVAGHSVNHLDLAPPFAGIMYAMTNTVGTTAGFIGPALLGILTNHHDTKKSWRLFFLISGAIFAFGGIVFVTFARAELQPWAEISHKEIIIASDSYSGIQTPPVPNEENKDSSTSEDSDAGCCSCDLKKL